tara:strand:- start:268 stop:996 length:729 start_codon:yes stop_codon:yes gene_type:complete
MSKYFNVFLEFNHAKFYNVIKNSIQRKKKGYVCVVDVNVLTMAHRSITYQSVINNALINTCDSSSIAMFANWIHKKNYEALNGPEIFKYFIEKKYKHLLLGSTIEITEDIKDVLTNKNIDNIDVQVMSLPFKTVQDFDYQLIADKINKIKPDIIWVSLGAPKQELFMSRIEPLINHGVLFGIGAAFSFYIGKLDIPDLKLGSLRLIWLNRLYNEPKKIITRLIPFFLSMPKIYWDEKKHKKS